MTTPPIAIRAGEADDLPFIFSAWLKSYRRSPTVKDVPAKVYFAKQHDLIERLLTRSGVLIAHPEGDPSTILGFAVVSPIDTQTIHWVYVKHAFRRMGIARRLLAGLDLRKTVFSHLPPNAAWIADACPGISFNPYITEDR